MAGQWAFNEGPVKAHQSEWAWPGTLCRRSSSRQWWCWPAHQIQPGKFVHTASQCSKHVTCGWKILIEDLPKPVTHFFSISCKKIGEVSAYSQSLASVKTQLDEGRPGDCIYFLRGIMHEKELIIVLLICVLMAQKLVDLSTTGSPRLIDGILLTKFDTIDDKVFCACAHLFLCEFLTHDQGLKVAYSWGRKMSKWIIDSNKILSTWEGIGCFPGWSSSVDGICIRCASHVCGLWSDIHRPEKAQCEIYCQVSPCVANCSLHWLFLFCESSWCDTVLCEAIWKQCS